MFKLTLASFVIHVIFVKFGSFTQPTTYNGDNYVVTIDAYRQQLYQIQIGTGEYSRIPLTNFCKGVAIDMNPLTKTLYWSDNVANVIMKAQMDGSQEEVFKTLPKGSISDGIAVDYINQLLFYTCTFDKIIVAVSLENKDIYKTIVNESIDKPRDIIVHPERGVIYWSDWGNEPRIETATMDGGNRSIIMSFEPNSWPNAIALDVKSMNLFWAESNHDVIGRINIDTGVKKTLYSVTGSAHFFGMTLVGDKLYITDWYRKYVSRLSVDGGNLEQVGPSKFSKLNGITGYKKTDIRTVSSKCLQSTCSHLCLPVSGKDYKCECSDGDQNASNPCREANECTPNYINLTISDDLPKGDSSTKISFFCNNWINISVYFRLDITYNEHRYFRIENMKSRNLNYLVLTIKNAPYINTWNTTVSVLKEPYKNETLNKVPIRIDVKEVNDRPTILPEYIITEVPEDVPVGTIVANLSLTDPDDGKFGDLQIKLESHTDIDVNGLFEVERKSKDTIHIKTASLLDAEEFWYSEDTYTDYPLGPTFLFDILVRDGGGLSAISVINVTVSDIGDIKPVCNNPTLDKQTNMSRKGETVTSLDNFCRARNYVSVVFYSQEVTYALSSDSCNLFTITNNGSVQLTKQVPNDIKTCTLSVQALDIVYQTSVTTFSLFIEFLRCLSDTDYMHIQWYTGIPGETYIRNCPTGYTGNVTRYCTKTGNYQDPVYNCTKASIVNIYNKTTVKEVNNPPTILPENIIIDVPEDVPVGTLVANLSLTDPDNGKFGDLQIKLESHTDIDVNGLFEVKRISKDTIHIKTASLLDADEFWDSEETHSKTSRGPTFLFDVLVRDGGGLSAISAINVTVIDIGDIEPVCNNPTLDNQTYMTRKGETVTSLDNFCRARNYVSAVFYSQEVTYALSSDSCNLFNISNNGLVQLTNRVPNHIKTCTVSVQALDIVYPTSVTTFSLFIEFIRCLSDTDYINIQWDTGIPGETYMRNCSTGYTGSVTRYCSKTGIYQDPVYNCTKASIKNIYNKLIEAKKTGQVNIVDVLGELSNETSDTDENSTLLIGDINVAVNTLEQIADVVTVNTTNIENVTDSYIQTINNILDESTAQTWKVNINQTGSGADVVLKTTDRFVEKILTTSKNFTAEISKSNLYLKMASVQSCNEALNFPEHGNEGVSEWARSRKDGLVIDCDSTVESFSGIMYRNLSLIISSSTNNTKSEDLQLNAPVISFTFYPNITRQLVSPVEIQFQLYNNTLDNARCSFWKESKSETSQGYWSDEGCRLKKYDKDEEVVVCVCDHLTNFAVLMSPSKHQIEEGHKEALSIISMIGCIVSMICLVLNVAIHAFFWRFIKSVRYTIHMNLSCWLIVAYILFLAGINRTKNKDVCTAMAVLLHLVFLIVFFGMLTEGCNLSYTVLKPLSSIKPGMPLMISSYVIAGIIVVISMGASQLQGYGTEQACWLSTETGLIWAFIAPVLVVIVVNFIIVVFVIRTMCGTTAMSKKSNKGRAKAALRCILVLMPLMGLTWGFGVLSLNSDTIAFQYIFAILNSFQGLLIFIFHCVLDKKIKDAFTKQRNKWLQSTQSFGVSEGKRSKTQDTSVF